MEVLKAIVICSVLCVILCTHIRLRKRLNQLERDIDEEYNNEVKQLMIQEDYCSEEVSKLLNEKGFDEDTERVYERNIMACRYEDYPMPTHQMAMKWLRKKHNIIIVIEPHSYNPMEEKVSSYVFSIWCGDNYENPLTINYPTFEEAVEAALKYCLTELI